MNARRDEWESWTPRTRRQYRRSQRERAYRVEKCRADGTHRPDRYGTTASGWHRPDNQDAYVCIAHMRCGTCRTNAAVSLGISGVEIRSADYDQYGTELVRNALPKLKRFFEGSPGAIIAVPPERPLILIEAMERELARQAGIEMRRRPDNPGARTNHEEETMKRNQKTDGGSGGGSGGGGGGGKPGGGKGGGR